MNKSMILAAAVAAGVMMGCTTDKACCAKKGCAKMTNQEFYDGGTFDFAYCVRNKLNNAFLIGRRLRGVSSKFVCSNIIYRIEVWRDDLTVHVLCIHIVDAGNSEDDLDLRGLALI